MLLAFLDTSPSPIMTRHVFARNPSAARATLRLAVAPAKGELSRETTAGGQLRANHGAAAVGVNTTRRLESWQPLEGLESLEGLFRSAAGAAALGVVLGLEAQQDYAHGAAFEAESVLGPLLGGLPCALSLNDHLRVAQETAGANPVSSPSTLGNQWAERSSEEAWKKVPTAYRLAKLLAELKSAGPRARNALVHQYNASFEAKARNRQSFVALVEAALVKVWCLVFLLRMLRVGGEIKHVIIDWQRFSGVQTQAEAPENKQSYYRGPPTNSLLPCAPIPPPCQRFVHTPWFDSVAFSSPGFSFAWSSCSPLFSPSQPIYASFLSVNCRVLLHFVSL